MRPLAPLTEATLRHRLVKAPAQLELIRDHKLYDPDGRELSDEEARRAIQAVDRAVRSPLQPKRPSLTAFKKGRPVLISAGR